MEDAVRYPVDYDAVHKGDVIDIKRVEEILGKRYGTVAYQAKIVGFICEFQNQLWDRGKPFTVINRRGTVAILTDTEASVYNRRWFLGRKRGLLKNHRQLLHVDASQFDPDTAKGHDRAVVIQGRTLAAMLEARTIRPVAYQRATAMLPAPPG
jgi:hypothetical protein